MPEWPAGRTPERIGSPGGRRRWPGGRIPGRTGLRWGRSSARQRSPEAHTLEHTGWLAVRIPERWILPAGSAAPKSF